MHASFNDFISKHACCYAWFSFALGALPAALSAAAPSLASASTLPASSLTQSEPIDGLVQAASNSFDAGDFSSAASQYKDLVQVPDLPWQQATLLYDWGTALLAQGQLTAALHTFESIDQTAVLSPLLNERLQFNNALARLLLVQKQWGALIETAASRQEDYLAMFQKLERAKEQIAKAEKARCQLEEAQGALTCEGSVEIKEMHMQIKKLGLEMVKGMHQMILDEAGAVAGVAMLLSAARDAFEDAQLTKALSAETSLREGYVENFSQKQQSWLPVWKKTQHFLQSPSYANQESKQLLSQTFESAFNAFTKGMAFLKEPKGEASLQSFKLSVAALQEVLKQTAAEETLEGLVQKILNVYPWLIFQDPVQGVFLHALIDMQALVQAHGGYADLKRGKDQYEKAEKKLGAALLNLQSDHPLAAKINIEEARYQMMLLLRSLKPDRPSTPEEILKEMIETEEHGLFLNRLLLDLEGRNVSNPDFDRLKTPFFQWNLRKKAKEFYEAARLRQAQDFPQEKRVPWDEVIPLMIQGIEWAELAEVWFSSFKGMQSFLLQQQSGTVLQEKTLDSWKQALLHLKSQKLNMQEQPLQNTQEDTPKSAQEARKISKQPQPLTSKEKQQMENASLNELLRSLQEMENDDHSLFLDQSAPANQEVERPW